jgi:hypothetical protein
MFVAISIGLGCFADANASAMEGEWLWFRSTNYSKVFKSDFDSRGNGEGPGL